MYSPYSHQIWTTFEKFICTYSFFKVQNKETKNKQPPTAKRHLALWPCSLSDTATAHGRMVSVSAATPLPLSAVGGYVFEGTLSTLKASRLYLEGYFILAGSPTMLFFFPYRVSQPRPWGEGTQLLREPPFQTDHLHMSLLQWLVVSQIQTQQQKEKAMKT